MKVVVRDIKPDVNNSGPVRCGSDVDLEGGFIQSVPFQYHHHHHDRFAQPESTFSSSSIIIVIMLGCPECSFC